MPTSSSAVTGEFNPTPFITHRTRTGEPIESVRDTINPRQINTDLSNVDDIPSTNNLTRGGFVSSKAFKIGIATLITCAVAASVAVSLATTVFKSSDSSSSSTIITTLTTGTTITTTSATTTTATTATTTTSTSSTSTTSTSTTSSTTSTTTTSSTTSTTTSSTTSTRTTTTTTTSTTTTTTTTTSVAQSPSYWLFDNNFSDSTSIYSGVGVNSPTFQSPGIDGYGSALSVNRANSQYVNIATFRNLTYTSFTVEMWFYSTALTSADYGFFGQYHAQTNDQSLHYQIRNYLLQMAFFADDLMGTTTIQINTWYHVAFVYDYSTSTQKIYLNGKLDGSRSSNPYQGISGATVIGKTEQVPGSPNYFTGYLDQMSLVMRSKNATEVLDDATLVTWNTFDGSYSDSGPLNLNITTNNVSFVSGRVNQAISFTSNSSYYQLLGFVLLGISNNPYSISLWVRPSIATGSVLVHLSTTRSGQGWCVDLIGFSSSGQIIITGWGSSNQQVIGPILTANVWTHVVDTYSTTNGHRLYVNGTLIGTTGSMTYIASGSVNILTLANSIQGNINGTCRSQSIVPNVYSGSIDEFRVYSRELNTTDIYTLANP